MPLTREQWALVRPLLPPPSPGLRNQCPHDDRLVLEGILWKLSRNAAWDNLPPEFPSYQTCYRRYRQWQRTGLMSAILNTLLRDLVEREGFYLQSLLDHPSVSLAQRGGRWTLLTRPDLYDTWQCSTGMIFIWIAVKRTNQDLERMSKRFPSSDREPLPQAIAGNDSKKRLA